MSDELIVLFTGNVTHKLDPKSRVAIPANWKAAQRESLVLIDACSENYNVLKCYTRQSFADMIKTVRTMAENAGVSLGDVNRYVGKITGRCFDAEVSTQGKLLIPKTQRERLKLTDTATIVGRGSYFEIWSPVDYRDANSADAMEKDELDKTFHILS